MLTLSDYLTLVHRYTPETALIGLSILKKDRTMSTRWYQRRYIPDLADDILANPLRNVYIRITPVAERPEQGRGTEAHSIGASVLWVDYDCYGSQVDGLRHLLELPLKPTAVISSGKGLQAYWSLDRLYSTPDELQRVKGANKGLLSGLDKDAADSCYDLARVLRAPETYNMKVPDNPLKVTALHYDPTLVYSLDQFPVAPVSTEAVRVWDQSDLAEDFLDRVKRSDKRLYARIISEDEAKKAEAALTATGTVDRSRNDAYICLRLLALGYTAGELLAVLTHSQWFSGAKYRATNRYDYVVTTVNSAVLSYEASPDRYFVKEGFKPEKLGSALEAEQPFLYAGETLYRYYEGVFIADGEAWVRRQIIDKLGKKWSSNAANETVIWLTDRYRVDLSEVNQHPHHINVANGMLQLETGELEPHSAGYRSINQLPVHFDANADTAAIDRFVGDILPADAVPVFWEYVGSALNTQQYWPKAYLALIGRGDSGKSKLLEFLRRFFGGNVNCSTTSFHDLADNRFAAAELWGKLANIFSDVDDSEAQSCGQIKTLTGDDYLRGERKFKGGFSFKNTARLFFSANQHLSVRGPDEAFFNRSLVIRCTNHFVAQPDPTKAHERQLNENILDEVCTPAIYSAALLRAYEGLRRLRAARAFSSSQAVINAQNEFRFVADTVAGFLAAAQYVPGYVIPKSQMYQRYRVTCEVANRRPVSEDRFFRRVTELAERLSIEEGLAVYGNTKQPCYLNRKPIISFLPQTLLDEARAKLPAKKGGS